MIVTKQESTTDTVTIRVRLVTFEEFTALGMNLPDKSRMIDAAECE